MQNHEHCIFDVYVHICKAVCMHLKMLGKITWSIYFSTRLHFNHTRERHESLNRCDTRRSDRFIQRNLFFAYVRFIRRATYYLHVDCSITRKGRFEFHQNSQTSSFPKRNKIFMHKMTEDSVTCRHLLWMYYMLYTKYFEIYWHCNGIRPL